jgi:hypothetical protein
VEVKTVTPSSATVENHRKKKLFDLERVVKEKENAVSCSCKNFGPQGMQEVRCKQIDTCLKSKYENLREKIGKANNQKLMQGINENQAPNAQQQQ